MTGREVYKWSVAERIGECGIAFVGNIILARLLTPADFGLLAMIAIFSAVVVNLSNCGISDGIIHKLEAGGDRLFNGLRLQKKHHHRACGGRLAFAFAPAIAAFFHHEELLWIMRIYGVCFFFRTMCFVAGDAHAQTASIQAAVRVATGGFAGGLHTRHKGLPLPARATGRWCRRTYSSLSLSL